MLEHLTSIQSCKIADEICANEYETCSALLRSVIKTAAAFHFSQSNQLKKQEIFLETDSSGFCRGIRKEPVPYVFLILDKNYNAPAKFLSVLCQAILASVPHIFVFADKNTDPETFNAYINCMELCGIENSYFLPDEDILCTLRSQLDAFFRKKGKTVLFSDKQHYFPKLGTQNTCKENSRFSIIADNSRKELLKLGYGPKDSLVFTDENINSISKNAREHFARILTTADKEYDISFIGGKKGMQNYGAGMEFCCLSPVSQDFFCSLTLFANLESNYPQAEENQSE